MLPSFLNVFKFNRSRYQYSAAHDRSLYECVKHSMATAFVKWYLLSTYVVRMPNIRQEMAWKKKDRTSTLSMIQRGVLQS